MGRQADHRQALLERGGPDPVAVGRRDRARPCDGSPVRAGPAGGHDDRPRAVGGDGGAGASGCRRRRRWRCCSRVWPWCTASRSTMSATSGRSTSSCRSGRPRRSRPPRCGRSSWRWPPMTWWRPARRSPRRCRVAGQRAAVPGADADRGPCRQPGRGPFGVRRAGVGAGGPERRLRDAWPIRRRRPSSCSSGWRTARHRLGRWYAEATPAHRGAGAAMVRTLGTGHLGVSRSAAVVETRLFGPFGHGSGVSGSRRWRAAPTASTRASSPGRTACSGGGEPGHGSRRRPSVRSSGRGRSRTVRSLRAVHSKARRRGAWCLGDVSLAVDGGGRRS